MGRLVAGCRCGYMMSSKPEATNAESVAKAMKALEAEVRENHRCTFTEEGGAL